MLLDGIFRYLQARGDLFLRVAVHLAQGEHLATPVGEILDGLHEHGKLLMTVDDLLDLLSFVEHVKGLHVCDQLNRDHLLVAEPVECNVAGDRQREGPHRADFRLLPAPGCEQTCIRLLQQLFDIGVVSRVAIQTRAQYTLEFKRL